jgi:hypothetical protein
MKTRGTWPCPSCHAKNPNLKRHYRSVADLCILGLVITVIVVGVGVSNAGLNLGVILTIGHAILLLITIVFVYKSKAPWADGTVKTLIWTVFGLALLFNVVIPFAFGGGLIIPVIIVYAFVFPYLFWLNAQANKCTASGAPPLPAHDGS